MSEETFILWKNVREKHFTKDELLVSDLTVSIMGEVMIKYNELGWTQEELSQKTGITQANISNIFLFKASPGIKTLAKILDALDLKIKVVRK